MATKVELENEVEVWLINNAQNIKFTDVQKLQRQFDKRLEVKRMADNHFAVYATDVETADALRKYINKYHPALKPKMMRPGEI